MTKQVVKYSVCDKCPHEREATVTDKFSLNGFKFEIDLCDEHSASLYAAVMAWADDARQTGEPSVLEQRRPVAKMIDVTPRTVTPPTPHLVEVEKTWTAGSNKPTRVATAQPPLIQLAASQDELPSTAQRWELDPHAEQRMEERNVDLRTVLMTAEKPAFMVRSLRNPKHEERTLGDVTVVVDPARRMVMTVWRNEDRAATTPQPTRVKAKAN